MPSRSASGRSLLALVTSGALVALVALVASVAFPRVARASEDGTIDAPLALSGSLAFKTLTVSAKLSVLPYVSGSSTSTGQLDILADTIVVTAAGMIDATGAGYAGLDGLAGPCGAASGCAQAGVMVGQPGGGGGFFGAGANGALQGMTGSCADSSMVPVGGDAVFSAAGPAPLLGSAGGAANLGEPGAVGGSGGGFIRLRATTIQIDGVVRANGADALHPPYGGVGSGGGSGGLIEITAWKLFGKGSIQANGGAGAYGAGLSVGAASPAMSTPNNGGGGSGGVVLLHLTADASPAVKIFTTGGATGTCATGAADGGTVSEPLDGGCVDNDGDGYTAVACGGQDCDDADAKIHPGAGEICNGVDDNCSGDIDEGANICPVGGVCVAHDGGASCEPIVTETEPGPTQIRYSGGCSMPVGGGKFGVAGLAALALLAIRSKRTR